MSRTEGLHTVANDIYELTPVLFINRNLEIE